MENYMTNKDNYYKYLIIGGGMASYAAVKGIRSVDEDNRIGIINEEEFAHYKRPWLSKKLWQNKKFDDVWLKTTIDNNNIEFFNKKSAVKLIPEEKKVIDNLNNIYYYEKLLIASGGKPKRFVDFKDDENIIYFRSMNDFYKLKSLAEEGKKIAIIGGGFIGSEIAAALALKKCKVTMIFPENGICGNIFPCNLSSFLNDYYQQKEINILNEDLVNDIKYSNMKNFTITTKKKKKLEAEVVVIGIGVEPNISFLKGTNIEIDKGIKVDKHLVTSNPSIFAAGDVSSFYYHQFDKRAIFEHEDNALSMGEIAGKNMAGNSLQEYNHLPFFYSDLFDLGYEAVGELNSEYEIIENWEEKFKKGRLFYFNENKIKGILLWNTWNEVEKATELINNNFDIQFNDKNELINKYLGI